MKEKFFRSARGRTYTLFAVLLLAATVLTACGTAATTTTLEQPINQRYALTETALYAAINQPTSTPVVGDSRTLPLLGTPAATGPFCDSQTGVPEIGGQYGFHATKGDTIPYTESRCDSQQNCSYNHGQMMSPVRLNVVSFDPLSFSIVWARTIQNGLIVEEKISLDDGSCKDPSMP